MTDLRFDGRVVVITGAAGALGAAYARGFAARGASLVLGDIDANGLDDLATALPSAVAVPGEATNPGPLIDRALGAFGRLDAIVANAGILRDASYAKMTHKAWTEVLSVHLEGTHALVQAAWSQMKRARFGRILVTTSASGLHGQFGQANYASAKMGIVGLMRALAVEGKRYDIGVNAIAPIAASALTKGAFPPAVQSGLSPDAVAPVALWLCHPEFKGSGQIVETGGGWIAALRWQQSEGVRLPDGAEPESVRDSWESVTNFDDSHYPTGAETSFFRAVRS